MNKKIRDGLFVLIIFLLIFNNIPQMIQMNFVGGILGSKLVFYPMIVFMGYYIYTIKITKCPLVSKTVYLKYTCFYIGVILLSLLLGLFSYPYFDVILSGPSNQIEKLPRTLAFLNNHGLQISYHQLLQLWIFTRPIKGLVLDTFYTFGGSYIIYCAYRNDYKRAIHIISYAIVCSTLVIFSYSSLEVLYLTGNETATEILSFITPLIHEIKISGSWWPPLLWDKQLRSVFAEPSYFGIWTAFAIPFLWLLVLQNRHKLVYLLAYLLVTILSFLLFLTKARTGFLIFLGEISILTILVALFALKKIYIYKWIAILLCCFVSFVASNFFIVKCMDKNTNSGFKSIESIENYIEKNAASLANSDKRSNRARYSIMEADFKIGLDHPVLGIGYSLRNGYIPDYLSERATQDDEVKMWLDFRKKLGILKFSFPKLGEYTSRFAETGLIGLFFFLTPTIILCIRLYRKIRLLLVDDRIPYICFITSLCGIMASGIGDTINITYCYWVLLGVGYAMCFNEEITETDSHE